MIYLDTETTGLSDSDEIVEIAIAGDGGEPVIDSLVRPERMTAWPNAQKIHGISPDQVRDAPTLSELIPRIRDALAGNELVIYNAPYDCKYLPADLLGTTQAIYCAMRRYAQYRDIWDDYHNGWKWHKLTAAAAHFGYPWRGTAHRALADALADALACRHVWLCLEERRHENWTHSSEENTTTDDDGLPF